MKRTTQAARVLDHLKRFGTITSREAIAEYGIMQLPRRIYDLRRAGHRIPPVEWKDGTNKLGEPVRYGVYQLKENV